MTMRFPTVNERLKEAPAHALRAAFAGIGQLLLVGDKLRAKASDQVPGRASSAAPTGGPATPGAPVAAQPTATPTVVETAASGTTTADATAGTATTRRTDKPPIQGYDHLSLPSLRARLRGMSAAQVRALADYERAHRDRPEFVSMYERRIEKLTAEQD